MRGILEAEGVLAPGDADGYEARARAAVDAAQAAAESAPDPSPESALGAVYAPLDADGG